MWWNKFEKEILNTDLYTRSGTEVGVSNNVLKLVEKNGDYSVEKTSTEDVPEIVYSSSCDNAVNYPEINKKIFGHYPKNWLVGNYKKIFIGHITDEEIRKNASSGGIISGIQLYLLKNQLIDGAISLRMRKDKPYLTEPFIAQNRRDVLAGAQSKYTVAPVNQILNFLPGDYKSLSYTGLPEQIAAIRKLQIAEHKSIKNINFILGIFYGESLGFSAIKSFLRTYKIKNLEDIASLSFRAGEWPGNMRVELKNGKIISLKKFHANYLIPSHITKYSLYQVDYMSELADISAGDAWSPKYEDRGKGWSTIIARNEKGLKLLEEMLEKKEIYLQEISEEELINMHSHGLDFKKRGAFIRIKNREKKGLPIPNYGYYPTNIPKDRERFEIILEILFKIFQSKITIWILEKIPPKIIGWFFIQARKIWKKRTNSTKKNNLRLLKFEINHSNDDK